MCSCYLGKKQWPVVFSGAPVRITHSAGAGRDARCPGLGADGMSAVVPQNLPFGCGTTTAGAFTGDEAVAGSAGFIREGRYLT